MSKQKQEKLTVTKTPENSHPQQLFVQIEGKLTSAQLEASAGGLGGDDDGDTANHNQSLVSLKEGIKSQPPPEKPRPHPPLVQLTEAQLEAIAEGLVQLTTFYTKFIEEQLISTEKLEKSIAISTPEKFCLDRLFIEI